LSATMNTVCQCMRAKKGSMLPLLVTRPRVCIRLPGSGQLWSPAVVSAGVAPGTPKHAPLLLLTLQRARKLQSAAATAVRCRKPAGTAEPFSLSHRHTRARPTKASMASAETKPGAQGTIVHAAAQRAQTRPHIAARCPRCWSIAQTPPTPGGASCTRIEASWHWGLTTTPQEHLLTPCWKLDHCKQRLQHTQAPGRRSPAHRLGASATVDTNKAPGCTLRASLRTDAGCEAKGMTTQHDPRHCNARTTHTCHTAVVKQTWNNGPLVPRGTESHPHCRVSATSLPRMG
jgi:hypothetical protein